jgi:hypothetical protein
MIRIRINGEERQYDAGIEPWINQQINRRQADNRIICTEVTIHNDPLNMLLRTPGCETSALGRGGNRPPTAQEQSIYDLWGSLGLNDPRYTGGQLVAFLKQLRRNS